MHRETVNKSVLLVLVVFISGLFFLMIRRFLMVILLAGIFAGLAQPLFRRFEFWMKGRRTLAALATLMVIVIVILLPMGGLLGIVTNQALKVGQSVTPWIQKQVEEPTTFYELLGSFPFYDKIQPYRGLIFRKAGEMVGSVSSYLISSLSSATLITVNLVFLVLIHLYTMFFFLKDGDRLLQKILYYLPLEDKEERRMLEKFTSVTRATLKGTLVIGLMQGGAAGLAFAVVGIPSAVFWGTIMVVLSIVPGIGTGLVWGPAAVILAASGHVAKGVGLAVYCLIVVGSIDNFLRPRLVGQDTQMHELFIFFGTLGGILFFGVLGFIIGPIVAALFVTIWDIYGIVFRDVLPEVHAMGQETDSEKETEKEQDAPGNADDE